MNDKKKEKEKLTGTLFYTNAVIGCFYEGAVYSVSSSWIVY